jgi:hypothetical protein
MSGKIFISYRRDDSRYQARMIYEAFLRGVSRENIFMDVDSIPLGVNFVKVLEGWVEQCEILLVLMGAGWASSTDPKTGKRRLDNQKDFVRVEIRGALTRDIPVVPVLLDGAELPDETELPDDIKALLNRNAEFVEYRTFDADVQRLIKKLGVGRSTNRPAIIAATQLERDGRSGAEGPEAQGDLADKPREKETAGGVWTKHRLTATVIATVLLGAAVIGTLVSWSPGLLSGRKAEVTTKEVDGTRQAAEAKLVDAEKARQTAEAKAADAEKALQAAQAQASDAEKARQAAEAKAADAEKALQAAQAQAAYTDKARQAAEAARQNAEAKAATAEQARQGAALKAADAETARQIAEAKLADAEKARQAAEARAAQPTAAAVRQTAPPGTIASSLFDRKTSTEIRGEAFQPTGQGSADDCTQICARDITCGAYSYDKQSYICYLYHPLANYNLVANVNYESGIRQPDAKAPATVASSLFNRSNGYANGVSLGTFNADSMDECEQLCAGKPFCKAYTYSSRSASCSLLSRTDYVSQSSIWSTGIRK